MANSVYHSCLEAVQAQIIALALSGISSTQIVIGKVADDKNRSYPAIVISPYQRETLDENAGTNSRDDIVYPILVSIIAADNQDQQANFDLYLTWRQKIRREFHNQRLTGVNEVITTKVEPRDVVDGDAWFQRNLFVSGLLLRFLSREPRGN